VVGIVAFGPGCALGRTRSGSHLPFVWPGDQAESKPWCGFSDPPGLDYRKEDFESAESTATSALKSNPEDPDLRSLLHHIYSAQKKYAESEKVIIDLIRDYPREARYFAFYARLMLETMHTDKAQRLAEEALRIEPEDISAMTVSILCDVINSKGEDVSDKLTKLVIEHPESEHTARSVLMVLIDRKNYKEALNVAQQLLRIDPSDEGMVNVIKELRIETHPTMLPLYPLIRWGWHASAVLWLAGIVMIRLSGQYLGEPATGILTLVWLGYIIYSWVYPPILRRILN
jgi:tetratricopeptide (TPR) repeat protein